MFKYFQCIKTAFQNIEALKKLNFMAPFYGWGSTASRLEPLRGGSLLFTVVKKNLFSL